VNEFKRVDEIEMGEIERVSNRVNEFIECVCVCV
jgi:hypothetical protein